MLYSSVRLYQSSTLTVSHGTLPPFLHVLTHDDSLSLAVCLSVAHTALIPGQGHRPQDGHRPLYVALPLGQFGLESSMAPWGKQPLLV